MSIARLQACLDALENVCPVDATEALETLSIYINNILQSPLEKKYRTIRISNIIYQERLGHLTDCPFLEAIGFEVHGDFLKLDPSVFVHDDGMDDSSSSSASSSHAHSSVDSVRIPAPTLSTLRRMKALVEARSEQMRRRWTEFEKAPHASHEWASIAAFSAADEIGRRSTMEDEFIAVDNFAGRDRQGFFALYDGHGGRDAVEFSVRALHLNLGQDLTANPHKPLPKIFEDAYLKTDAQIRRQNIMSSGTTAVTCLLRDDPSGSGARALFAANVGDSRAVLCRSGQAVRLTKDHKATDPEEAQRVQSRGGFVGRFGRVNGVLAISRALGDHLLKGVVSAQPYTTDTTLNEQDDFLILACDGIWDVMSDQEAVDHVIEHVRNRVQEACYSSVSLSSASSSAPASSSSSSPSSGGLPSPSELVSSVSRSLIHLALDRRTMDNVTVMVVFLKAPMEMWSLHNTLHALRPAMNPALSSIGHTNSGGLRDLFKRDPSSSSSEFAGGAGAGGAAAASSSLSSSSSGAAPSLHSPAQSAASNLFSLFVPPAPPQQQQQQQQ